MGGFCPGGIVRPKKGPFARASTHLPTLSKQASQAGMKPACALPHRIAKLLLFQVLTDLFCIVFVATASMYCYCKETKSFINKPADRK